MSFISLDRFTVPIGEPPVTQGLLMPKLKYRFRVTMDGFGVTDTSTELTKQVIDFSRPQVSFNEETIDVYNSRVKYAGKYTWANVTLNVRDDSQGLVSRLVGEQLQKQFDFYEQASAISAGDYKFSLKCEMLDGGNGALAPVVLETWELLGCYLQDVNYTELNYSESTPVQITMAIAFDNALQAPGEGVGSTVRNPSTLTVGTLA